MCQPIAQPATSALKNITAYGATTGASDNSAAIQNACAAAGTAQSGGPLAQTSGIYIPAGTFNHTAQMTLNCNIYGQGPTSELYCPNPTIGGTNCEILTNGSNQVWSQWKHYVNSPSGNDSTNWNLFINGGSNNRTDTLFLYGGNAGGIINQGTTNEIDTNNGIFFTKRDANYHADGTVLNSTVDHTYVYGSGDDSDSNVTYSGTDYVDGSLVQWNTFTNNTCPDCARGMSVPGGRNMTFQDNLVQNIYDAGMYIAQESGSFTENPVSNIIVRYNFFNDTMTDVSTGHAAIFFWSSISGSGGISNVDILGNIIAGTGSGAAALETQNCSGCTLNNVSFTNNTVTGSTGMWSSTGTSSNISCSGNTYNGSPSNSGAAGSGQCTGTNTATATGSPVTYSGCVVGTAKQYTGPIAISGSTTINAVAVIPGLTNSSVGSGTFNSGGTPVLTQCGQWNTNPYPTTPYVNTLTPGGSVQQAAWCYYASLNTYTNCTTPDTYGNGVTNWGPPSSTVISVGQIGSAHPGLVTGLSAGTANSTATVTGGVSCSSWGWTVSGSAPTLTGATVSLQGGGTSVNVGGTAQACANMTYTNPTENTQVCGAGTDAYGTQSPTTLRVCLQMRPSTLQRES